VCGDALKSRCVVLAGGGTGGHLAPGLAVAGELRRRLAVARVVFVGTGRPLEEHLVPQAGFELLALPAPRLPRSPGEALLFPMRLGRSLRSAHAVLRDLKPDIVVGLGGYGSFPTVVAARRFGVPVVLLEQNSIPGKANRWLSRLAREVYVQFESARPHFHFKDRVHVLGNPLRRGITEGTRQGACEKFSLDSRLKTLLILGGSQGATRINRAACDALSLFAASGLLQVIHQTGLQDFWWVSSRHKEVPMKSFVTAFIEDMPDALAVADLIVGRAGATTLAEIAAVGRPSVLVPYPHAADNHQYLNAKIFEAAGAAILHDDSTLDGAALGSVVMDLIADDTRRDAMARASRTLAMPDATRDVCDRIIALMPKGDT
jgi:UDP-N-acetylglucosamine--N-acetylmuramyl-(pentapeptide) pyrophosphoryl-undecaprenol N-acetylglucosamine transferase